MQLTRIERRILALLEEAGEENIATLLHTVAFSSGNDRDVQILITAVSRLNNAGYVEIGTSSNDATEPQTAADARDSRMLLNTVAQAFKWNPALNSWEWISVSPVPQIFLTRSGLEVAQDILEVEGYPIEQLEQYHQD
jgi:hypothetical protein